MMKIGAFRAWVLKKIEEKLDDEDTKACCWEIYEQAMNDVAEYIGFPLDKISWAKWQP